MKKSSLKLTCIILIAILTLAVMPMGVRAADEAEGVILEKADEKIVYVKDMKSTEYKYAFSDNETDASSATYVTATKDSNEEYVASLEKDKTYKYMFIQQEGTSKTLDLSTFKNITENEIKKVEKLTKSIKVKTSESDSSVSKDGDKTITKVTGKIVISDDGNYQYQLIEVVDKNDSSETIDETALELYNELAKLEKAENMYEKLLSEITIKEDYNKLIDNAKWKDAKKKEIPQPEDSQKGEVFIALIREVKDGETVRTDIQIMTCGRADDEGVEETEKQVEKKTKLPVTGENLALYIIFGIIILAIIILIIRMRKTKKDEE